MKCTSALLHCTSLINEPRIVDALLPNSSAVEPESATEQAETCGTYSITRYGHDLIYRKSEIESL